MALPTNRGDREMQKFVENAAGFTAVRVVATDASGSDLAVAEDAAHASGDAGMQMLSVRTDTAAARAGTDGDYQPLITDASGRLHVNVGTGGTTQYAEDAAHVSAHSGTMALGVRKATPANLSDTDGDYEPLQVSAGRLWASATVDAALPAGANAIGKLAANTGVDIGDVDVTSIAAGDNNIGNVDIVTVPADPYGANADAASATGSISAKLRFIAGTGIPVTGTATVANAGTFATQVDGAALTSLQLIDDAVFADDAAFTPATSKVLAVGATLDNTTPDSVDEGDVGALRMSADRALHVADFPQNTSPYAPSNDDSAAYEASSVVKASAGILYEVTGYNSKTSAQFIQVFNSATVPADTAVPVITFTAAASSNFSWSGGKYGKYFSTGISWSNSSTGATKTLGSADVFANVQYA